MNRKTRLQRISASYKNKHPHVHKKKLSTWRISNRFILILQSLLFMMNNFMKITGKEEIWCSGYRVTKNQNTECSGESKNTTKYSVSHLKNHCNSVFPLMGHPIYSTIFSDCALFRVYIKKLCQTLILKILSSAAAKVGQPCIFIDEIELFFRRRFDRKILQISQPYSGFFRDFNASGNNFIFNLEMH